MANPEQPVDGHGYLRILYRHRRLAGAAFCVPAVLAFVYAFTATPAYRATARLLIEEEDPNVVNFPGVVQRSVRASIQTTQRDMLRSRSLAEATLDRLDAWDHPDFGGGEDGRFNPLRAAGRALTSLHSVLFPSAADRAGAEDPARARAITMLQARLNVLGGRNSRVIRVNVTASEAQLAADAVNTLARLHIERDMEFRSTSSRDASRWLQERIAEQRRRLEESERALQRYREERGAAAVEDRQNIIVRELENLHSAVTQATMARIESEARYRDLQAAQDDPEALGRFPEILRNGFIQELRLTRADLQRERTRLAEELGPRHPDMISIESSIRDAEEQLRDEILAVVDSSRIEFEVASSQERQLAAELDRQTQEALALDRTGIEYGVMRREAESDRRLYESLLQRAAETGVTGELETSNIRILDAAQVPSRPIRPQRPLILLLGLLGGAGLAVGLVVGIEYLDDTVNNPEELKAHLDAPYLGMVPNASSKGASAERRRRAGGEAPERRLLLTTGAPGDFVESLRMLRTALIFSMAADGCRTVMVTSAVPGEGKSCLSSNLAIALAQTGLRTLLVDTDLRRPRQHTDIGVDLEPGLSNLLVADAVEEDVVRETRVPKLFMIPAGKMPPNPTELLGSDRFSQYVESWRDRFDWIVIDSTPVLPVADAVVTARVVDEVLFVVAAGASSWRSAADALEKLEPHRCTVGTVLNKASVERHPYYYSRYYRASYGRYYNQPQAHVTAPAARATAAHRGRRARRSGSQPRAVPSTPSVRRT